MHERPSEPTELDDKTEEKIARIMDTRGYSRADAEAAVDASRKGNLLPPSLAYEAPVQRSAPMPAKRPRTYYSRPRVTQDSQDEFTGLIDREQAKTNTRGAALVREIFRVDQVELTPQERAIARAKLEKRGRRF
jgi:hypothetical protein